MTKKDYDEYDRQEAEYMAWCHKYEFRFGVACAALGAAAIIIFFLIAFVFN